MTGAVVVMVVVVVGSCSCSSCYIAVVFGVGVQVVVPKAVDWSSRPTQLKQSTVVPSVLVTVWAVGFRA